MNEILAAFIVALTATSVMSRPENTLSSKKFSERTDILTVDPRYEDLKKEAEMIVKKFVNNVTIETASLMNKIITSVDQLYIKMELGDCVEEAKKELITLKGTILRGFGNCSERQKVEEGSWALGILSAALVSDIQRAADDSLNLCMKKEDSQNFTCRINPEDETSKKFEILKKKVEDLAMNAASMYTDAFLPFVNNCFDKNKFESELQSIKEKCPNEEITNINYEEKKTDDKRQLMDPEWNEFIWPSENDHGLSKMMQPATIKCNFFKQEIYKIRDDIHRNITASEEEIVKTITDSYQRFEQRLQKCNDKHEAQLKLIAFKLVTLDRLHSCSLIWSQRKAESIDIGLAQIYQTCHKKSTKLSNCNNQNCLKDSMKQESVSDTPSLHDQLLRYKSLAVYYVDEWIRKLRSSCFDEEAMVAEYHSIYSNWCHNSYTYFS